MGDGRDPPPPSKIGKLVIIVELNICAFEIKFSKSYFKNDSQPNQLTQSVCSCTLTWPENSHVFKMELRYPQVFFIQP